MTFSLSGGFVFLGRGRGVMVLFISQKEENFVFHNWLDMTIKDKANSLKQPTWWENFTEDINSEIKRYNFARNSI